MSAFFILFIDLVGYVGERKKERREERKDRREESLKGELEAASLRGRRKRESTLRNK